MPSTPSKRPRLGLTLVINTLVHMMAINSNTATRFALQVTGKDALGSTFRLRSHFSDLPVESAEDESSKLEFTEFNSVSLLAKLTEALRGE